MIFRFAIAIISEFLYILQAPKAKKVRGQEEGRQRQEAYRHRDQLQQRLLLPFRGSAVSILATRSCGLMSIAVFATCLQARSNSTTRAANLAGACACGCRLRERGEIGPQSFAPSALPPLVRQTRIHGGGCLTASRLANA